MQYHYIRRGSTEGFLHLWDDYGRSTSGNDTTLEAKGCV
jgi:hypothetical protein